MFQILSYEPASTIEGVRCETTKAFAGQLDSSIALLKKQALSEATKEGLEALKSKEKEDKNL